MADPQDREGPTSSPSSSPAKKAPVKKATANKAVAKKAPAKKAPAQKAAANKAAAKKAPAKKAPAKKAQPALTARVEPPALTAAPVRVALSPAEPAPVAPPDRESFGRGHAIPISLALAGAGLVALVLGRLLRN